MAELVTLSPEKAEVLVSAQRHGVSRRAFLRGTLATMAVALSLDVDRLLWLPGEKTLILPATRKVFNIIGVRLTEPWLVTEGHQAILNQTVPITLNHQFQLGVSWSSADSAMLVESE